MRASNSREFTGFGEIVVRAHLEPEDAIHLVGAAREDDERHIARRAQAPAQRACRLPR